MQSNINCASGCLAVVAKEAKERIKRRGCVRIQERGSQSGLTSFADGQILSLVSGITKASFPVPGLEIVAKFSHLALEPDVEKTIPVSELLASLTGVVNAAKPNTSSDRDWNPVNNQGCVRDRERIKRILDWHTDAGGAKAHVSPWNLEWIRHKRNSCEGCIEKRTRVFKVSKYHQVFVAEVARERAVEALAISRRQRWRESREVKGDEVPIQVVGVSKKTLAVIEYGTCGPDIKWRCTHVRS